MKNKSIDRRIFLKKSAEILTAAATGNALPSKGFPLIKSADKLAILGGTPVHKGVLGHAWPFVDEKVVESVVKTTRSGVWSRIQSKNGTVPTFEGEFSRLIGSEYCVATGSGTQALSTCVEALNIGPGDEVITSPYTDFGTISAILTSRALPVMVDLDPDTFQLDPDKIEKHINSNTRAIMPVHIMGVPANMERIMEIAQKHKLKVIEDACQAPFSRYQGKAVGLIGHLGCFSFQASKAIACGEGGAVVGNDQSLMDECFTVQNRGANKQGVNTRIGPKYRMNEFEGAVLMGQLSGARARFEVRNENANYLRAQLKDFKGLVPQKHYPGTESGSYYHFGLTYNKEHFNNASRAQFLKAAASEGMPFGSYIKNGLHREPWVDTILNKREYKTMYTEKRLQQFRAALNLPNCDRITDETLVSFWGSGILLGSREEMDKIVQAIHKIHENRDHLTSL